ncbi:MAG: hypothetical protein AMS27_07500, partial [Bacteroides sp. SM23_62_1]
MELITSIKARADELIARGYETDIGRYISEGFRIFEKDAGNFLGYTVLYFLITIISCFIPFAPLFITGPLTAGFFIVARKIKKGESYDFGEF